MNVFILFSLWIYFNCNRFYNAAEQDCYKQFRYVLFYTMTIKYLFCFFVFLNHPPYFVAFVS